MHDYPMAYVTKWNAAVVATIERLCSHGPMGTKAILKYSEGQGRSSKLWFVGSDPAGWLGYTNADNGVIQIDRLIVKPSARRKGLGTEMLKHVLSRLGPHRNRATIAIPESHLTPLKFLRTCSQSFTNISTETRLVRCPLRLEGDDFICFGFTKEAADGPIAVRVDDVQDQRPERRVCTRQP
jgi:GNAT superfamily N-acetyltransferase